jgi:LysM repeat protein
MAQSTPGTTYAVQKGDTLRTIAQRFYNDGNQWEVIYNANKRVIGSNPNVLRVGEVLTIPVLTPMPGATYIVQKGDSLSSIAQRAYGDGNQWTLIYKANQQLIGNDPNLFRPRELLYIPQLPLEITKDHVGGPQIPGPPLEGALRRKIQKKSRERITVSQKADVVEGKIIGLKIEELGDSSSNRKQFSDRKSAIDKDRAKERIVHTGFAYEAQVDTALDAAMPLACGQRYYFWVEIGKAVLGSIEEVPTSLPEDLPSEAKLAVALFAFPDQIQTTVGEDVGELQLRADGSALVTRQPFSSIVKLLSDENLLKRCLLFPVRTPAKAGIYHLRCNIYYEQILIQSRLITARVMRRPQPGDRALNSVVDYTLSRKLDPAHLVRLEPHRLSLMLNSNSDGTHCFRFLGEENFKGDATFDGQELQDMLQQARGALRNASWGDFTPWQKGKIYLYGGPRDLNRLTADLKRFAIRGYRIYDAIINRLAGDPDQVDDLADLMRIPGLVQIALKKSARFIFPASLIYDYAFDTGADLTLCPAFVAALDGPAPLENLGCFQGTCPSRGAENLICPSGFWGYRHYIGLPLSVATGQDTPTEIAYEQRLQFTIGVSTDPDLKERLMHEQALHSLRQGLNWNYANTREMTLTLLKETQPHLVYFYCHGGVADNVPYIQVGSLNERGITRDNLRYKKIQWMNSRPLVFINGCHTTSLEPEITLEFVSAFVENAGASGVIGTEITIFEPLARAFAEECLRRFTDGLPIGEAIRGARLKLLKEGNPLGLAYIPYVMASLHLKEQTIDMSTVANAKGIS